MKKLLNHLKGALLLLLLLISFSGIAAKPIKPPPAPTTVIDSAIIDYIAGTITINGSGFSSNDTVVIGNTEVTIVTLSLDENSLILDFDNDTANAVTTAGSYLLSVNDSAFSVYFKAPVFNQNTAATCPCEVEWEGYKNAIPPLGFAGVTPLITANTSEKVEVQYLNLDEAQLWILNSEYSGNIQHCALVIDGATVTITPEEHVACSSYLRAL